MRYAVEFEGRRPGIAPGDGLVPVRGLVIEAKLEELLTWRAALSTPGTETS